MAEDGNRSSLASCRLLFDPDGGRDPMAPLRGPKLWEGSGCCFRCRVGFRGFIFCFVWRVNGWCPLSGLVAIMRLLMR